MTIAQQLLDEFEQQVPTTKKFLERLPHDALPWKPHPRSMTAGQLALHLAAVPGEVVRSAQAGLVPPPNFSFPQPESVEEVITEFEGSIAIVRELLPTFDDAAMSESWRIVAGDQVLLALPKYALLRNIMLNHWYQHRGQFGVYLRLLDIAVPSSWGPSADEPAPLEPIVPEH